MMSVRERRAAVANLFGLPMSRLSEPKEERRQFDVWVLDGEGNSMFRLGYFDDNYFTRENPVHRALRKHGISVREGKVGQNSEPQYDMFIVFDAAGQPKSISDQRIAMEAGFA